MVADLGPAGQFPEGSVRGARAGRRALVVVHRAGRLYALRDQCPHQGAPLSSGRVLDASTARLESGRPQFSGCGAVLQCPWHGWAFRLDDGCAVATPGVRIKSYPARVAHGRVLVEL